MERRREGRGIWGATAGRGFALGAAVATAAAQQPRIGPSEESVPPGWAVAATADADADGDVDLICSDGTSAAPTVLLNVGDGRFVAPLPATPAPYVGSAVPGMTLATADFNGDGLLDVAYAAQNSVVLRFGAAPGVFAAAPAPLPPPQGGFFALYTVAAGDADADGDQDLLIGQALGPPFHPAVSTTRLWLNDGFGNFSDATAGSGLVAANVVVTFVDLDGDGLPDALGQSIADGPQSTGLVVGSQRNLGGGQFAPPTWVAGVAGSFGGGPCPVPLTVGDFDGDGSPELLVPGPYAGQVQIVRRTGPFAFAADPPTYVGPECVVALRAFDLDADGADEAVLVYPRRTEVRPLVNGGLGPAAATVAQGCDAPNALWARTAVGDADGDGDADLLLCGERGPRRWLFNDGAGGFAAPYGRTPSGAFLLAGPAFERPTPALLDGDLRPDLIVGGSDAFGTAELRVAMNDGEGRFPAPATVALPGAAAGAGARLIAAFDADGDGDDDFLLGAGFASFLPTVRHRLVRNDGPGGFATFAIGAPSTSVARAGAAADFDGDGDADLALALAPIGAPGEVRFYANDGVGGFAHVATTGPFPGAPDRCAAADLDGDGDADLAAVLAGSGGTTLLNAGGFGFAAGPAFAPAYESSLQAADLDGDGDVDLSTGGVLQLLSGGAYAASTLSPAASAFAPASLVDVDGDGRPDVHLHLDGALMLNLGWGAFAPDPSTATLPPDPDGSTAWADFDGDGDVDAMSAAFVLHENRTRGIAVGRHPRPGAAAAVDHFGAPGGAYLLASSFAPAAGAPLATPFGALVVDPFSAVLLDAGILDASGRATSAWFLSAAAGAPFVGLSFVMQGVVDDGVLPRLTNARTVSVLAY